MITSYLNFEHFPKIWHQTRCFGNSYNLHDIIYSLVENCIVAVWYIASLLPKFWHFPKIQHQTRSFEIPTTFKQHHLLIGKNKFMVIAMHKFYIFRKLYSGCIIHFIASILNFDIFQKYDTKLDVLKFLQPPIAHWYFEIPTNCKHHLFTGKNKFMVIAMHEFYCFKKLYSGCIIHFIV